VTYGLTVGPNGPIPFGFSSMLDWMDSIILSFPAPWTISDRTHYGTEIFDSRSKHVLSVQLVFGAPSERQRRGMTDEEWAEYSCDSHWESEAQWHLANAVVSARNSVKSLHDSEYQLNVLRGLILGHCSWADDVIAEIHCGGPEKRRLHA
jgi:hypothetical protein